VGDNEFQDDGLAARTKLVIPSQHTEEVLQVSYVSAVVSQFGHTYIVLDKDYGTDGIVRRIKRHAGQIIDLGTAFDCQLKATINWEDKDGTIVFDLDADAYNKLVLRNTNSDTPILLILLCLPPDRKEWISVDANSFQIRRCCYFSYLTGEPTSNTGSKRIFIPAKNVFDLKNLELLFADFDKAVRNE